MSLDLPPAVICDIDGTLAEHHRSPYDYASLHTDAVIRPIRTLVNIFNARWPIILVTGRPEDYRVGTEAWLESHYIPYWGLFMRPSGDLRADNIIKAEIYERDIAPYWDVKYVLDDRDRVVKMWRGKGLTCLQVAPGDF